MTGVGPEITDAGKAIGLFGPDGNLVPAWFNNPLASVESLLTNPNQREALLDLLDQLFEPETPAGAPPDEKWHPLLGQQPNGNLYLTVANGSGPLKLGLAGLVHSTASPLPASLRAHLPLILADATGVHLIAGHAGAAFDTELRIELNWSPSAGQAISLAAIRVTAKLTPSATPPASLQIVLEGLSLDGGPARDALLDPGDLGSEAFTLIIGLLREKLRQIAAAAAGESAAVANHLMPLLGLADGFPPFPFAGLTTDPSAFRTWFAALISSGKMADWLGHLGSIFGGPGATIGSGTQDDPWRVQVFQIDANSGLEITLARVVAEHSGTASLEAGLRASFVPAGPNPIARIQAAATLASLPLSGLDTPAALPSASITVVAPGDPANQLVSTAAIAVASVEAGVCWDGTNIVPTIQLDNVTLQLGVSTTHYDRLDLTNTGSVIADASIAVRDAIQAGLGAGIGQHLAALAGIADPAGDPGWTHKADLAALVSHPSQAIATVHRGPLLDPAHNWSFLFAEAAALLGLGGAVQGSGTRNDPWRVSLAPGSISIELAAWNAQESGNAADPQQLRLGLRAAAESAPWHVWWLAELLAFDLPASGPGTLALMAGQHAEFLLQPAPVLPETSGISIKADSLGVSLDWTPGGSMALRAVVSNLSVTAGSTVTVPTLTFPPPASFDISNPLPAIGVSAAELHTLFRLMFTRGLLSWVGQEGLAISALLGLNGNLPGLPADWPTLSGDIFGDPFTSLRTWINQLALTVSSDGSPFLPSAFAWLSGWLNDGLPGLETGPAPDPVNGAGSYDDPWAVAVAGGVELLAWLEPAGPPANWASGLSASINRAEEYYELLSAVDPLQALVPSVREALSHQDLPALSNLLDELDTWFATTDGFVPASSQIPTGGTWTSGTPIQSAHPVQPSDPSAIAQINSQIAAWNPADKVVLLIGPGFSDHAIWNDFLTPVAVKPNFNFRLNGVDPALVDLSAVAEVSDFYTADFQENGVAGITAQLERVIARIGELRPGIAVTVVAHSTAGLAARAFAAAHSELLRGLIAVGCPLQGSPVLPLRDPSIGSSLRAVKELTPVLPAGPLRDAVDALIQAMDGFLPAAGPAQLPAAKPFPLDAFPAAGSTDTGTVPAFAIGGALAGSLFEQVQQTAAALATSAAGAVTPLPTHLSFGARAHLDFGASGTVQTEVSLRGDAGRVALTAGAGEPARPAHSFSVQIALSSATGWLAGSPFQDVRVRWAELGLSVSANGVQPELCLHGTAFHSPSLGLVDLAQPQAQPLIGAIFHAVADLGPNAGAAFTALTTALTSLGVVTTDPHGGFGISNDAWTAMISDPAGFLTPRINAALAQGVAGFTASNDGAHSLSLSGTSFQIYLQNGTFGLRTNAPVSLGTTATLTLDARIDVASFAPSLDLSLSVGAATLTHSAGNLTLSAPPWLAPLSLVPLPSAADLKTALSHAVPRLLLSSAASAVLEATLDPGAAVVAIDPILESLGKTLISGSALGNGTSLDATKVTNLLQAIAAAAGLPAGPGLALPANLTLTATGSDPVELKLSTSAPLGGVVDLQLSARIDRALHVTPAGTIALRIAPLGTWDSLAINFGVDAAGVSLTIAPQAVPPIAPIQLLPSFSGLGSLAGAAAEALLPAALDALVDAVGPSTLLDHTLAVAQAFDLYDPVGKFSDHSAQLAALTRGNWSSAVTAAMQTTAIPAIRDLLGSITASAGVSSNTVTIGAGGQFSVALGWDSAPTVALHTHALKAANGAITADVDLGYIAGRLSASVTLGLALQSSLGVSVVPSLVIAYNGTSFSVQILPLGAAKASTLAVTVAPNAGIQTGGDLAGELAEDWLLPITADLLIGAARPHFNLAVWAGGPTLQKLLADAGLIDAAGDLSSSFPDFGSLVLSLLTSFATAAELDVDKFKLKFVKDAKGLGLNLRGSQDLALGSVGLSLRLENTSLPTATPGVTVYIFDPALKFAPVLSVAGLGVEFTGPGGGPLVSNSSFRIEGAGGYLYFDFDGSLTNLGGAVGAKGLGLPLSLLGGSHDGGNPVASSLLEGVGSGNASSGDPNPVNPSIDVLAAYVGGAFSIQLGSPNPPLWIGVHRSFGPIYIEQIGLEWTNDAADLLVDGSVRVAALTVQAYELGLKVGFRDLLAPEHWSLDLKGLAVGFQSGAVSIAGGLSKNPGPPIEYDGMLSVEIAGRGFTVVGGYARPIDSQGSYTSLFIFVSLPIPLGGPPFLFVTGLGGGAGYNRQLIPPTDLNQIPSFFLVSAIDDDSLANNPMGALVSMGKSVPPQRGGFWLAAGIRFNSFVVVNTVAVVYVALDRGFEIGILGVSHMQLPAPGIELVSIELALKARFSTAEEILSIQAQLTSNSWLFSRDCQLTGGFAFFIWFRQGHFVLTMGGYHPAFQKPPEFPDVPRLGFHWQALDIVQIKGEAYFAVSSSAFMAGGRLDASAGFSGIRAWFTVHVDVLIQWDPFHYDFLGGIQVGVSLRIEVCFFGACAGVQITISRGADIHIFGPPFHADLTFDAYITSITLSFGGDPHPQPDPLPWATFRDKYLISGNPENTWVSARVISGILTPDPPGAQPSPGAQADPWKLNPEFAFLTESRMPVSGYAVIATAIDAAGAVVPIVMKSKADARLFDLAPMQKLKVGSAHSVTITPAVTHPDQFLVEEILDLVPEAPWRWYDPSHLPAAANRINAISGLRVTGFAVLQGKSALIPISTLVDDDPRFALPLPFATVLSVVGTLQTAGLTAEALAALAAGTGSGRALAAAHTVLTGIGFFEEARRSVGFPAAGIPPLAANALVTRRSSPPLLTPLSTGLSMKSVGLSAPPTFTQPQPVSAVFLQQPRLRAVLQTRSLPLADAPPVLRTTATKVSVTGAPRTAAPQPKVTAGARLHRVSAPTAAAPTTAAIAARSLRNPEVAALLGPTHSDDFDIAAKAVLTDGLKVPAGATHVWEVPSESFSLDLIGSAAVRIAFMDRAGNMLEDTEIQVGASTSLNAPAGCEMTSVTCLGALPEARTAVQTGFGAISSLFAPSGGTPVVGWQTGNLLPQVGPSNLLARGASLILRKAHFTSLNNQRATQAMTQVSSALAGQSGVETWLPQGIGVVMILLDQQDPTAADQGDLAIACDGATLATPPVAGAGGRRRALLYDVTGSDPKAEHITIAVGSKAGWALAGVVGLPGRAGEWAARLHGSVPPHLVPDGPLTPGGEIRVRLNILPGGAS